MLLAQIRRPIFAGPGGDRIRYFLSSMLRKV